MFQNGKASFMCFILFTPLKSGILLRPPHYKITEEYGVCALVVLSKSIFSFERRLMA